MGLGWAVAGSTHRMHWAAWLVPASCLHTPLVPSGKGGSITAGALAYEMCGATRRGVSFSGAKLTRADEASGSHWCTPWQQAE